MTDLIDRIEHFRQNRVEELEAEVKRAWDSVSAR
jgi:hypothetical protein